LGDGTFVLPLFLTWTPRLQGEATPPSRHGPEANRTKPIDGKLVTLGWVSFFLTLNGVQTPCCHSVGVRSGDFWRARVLHSILYFSPSSFPKSIPLSGVLVKR
jgi:hypothetical protein